MGDPEDYSIAREGVWGREGARDRRPPQAGGFILEPLGAVFARGNEVKSLLAALGMVLLDLGSLLGRLGAVLGRSWAVLG